MSENTSTSTNDEFLRWLPYGALLLGLFIIYTPALRGGFLIDDIQYISDNPLITRSPTPWHFWTWTRQADYWPFFYTILWYLWKLFGTFTTPYHVLNVSLHFANACLLGKILDKHGVRLGKWWVVFAFAFHPLCTQAVAWIFQLKTLLSTCLIFLSWLQFVEWETSRSTRAYGKALLFFFLGLMSKNTAVFLPILMSAYAIRRSVNWRKTIFPLTPFFAISFFSGVMTLVVSAHTFSEGGLWDPSISERILTSFTNVFFYLKKVVFPWPVRFAYPWKSFPSSSPVSWLAPVAFTVLAWDYFKRVKDSNTLRGFAYFELAGLVLLTPALGFVSIPYMRYSLVADHYLYLSLGVFLGGLAFLIGSGWGHRYAKALWAVPVLFAASSHSLSAYYANSESLWNWTAPVGSSSVWAQYNRGATLVLLEKFEESIAPLKRAAFGPSDSPETLVQDIRHQSLFSLARSLMETNRPAEAAETLERLLSVDPRFPNALYNLAMLYHQKLGQLDRAEWLYKKNLQTFADESTIPSLINICNILIIKKDFIQAKRHCEDAQKLGAQNPELTKNISIIRNSLKLSKRKQ